MGTKLDFLVPRAPVDALCRGVEPAFCSFEFPDTSCRNCELFILSVAMPRGQVVGWQNLRVMLCREAQRQHVKVEGEWKAWLRVRVSAHLPSDCLHVLVSEVM
jgi:hypothetical protein